MKVNELKKPFGEWEENNEFSLKHPSIIAVDITKNPYPSREELYDFSVLKTKQIASFKEKFRPFKIKGFEFCWTDYRIDRDAYAIFLGYKEE